MRRFEGAACRAATRQPIKAAGREGEARGIAIGTDEHTEQVKTKGLRAWSLRKLFVLLLVGLYALSLAIFVVFDVQTQREQTEGALLEEARVFSHEMDAVWQFMDNSQNIINRDAEGNYEFKGLYCSLVGKSVGRLFSAQTDYTIRYTNFDPRNVRDTPDAFEEEALTSFNDTPAREYYGIADFEGEEAYRYVGALRVQESCLECHGEPVGELDPTGHAKEGWTTDSVGGAVSVVIPVDRHMADLQDNVLRDVAFFTLQAALIALVAGAAMQFLVFRPLDRMGQGFKAMRAGDPGVKVSDEGCAREMAQHIDQFNAMADELQHSMTTLEDEVARRTHELTTAKRHLELQRDMLERTARQLSQEVRYKSDLLSMVNHELRTPLTSIITMAQVSLDMHEPATERERRAWESVQKNGTVLLGIVNDMLDIAKQEAGAMVVQCEPVDIAEVLCSVRKRMQHLAASCAVTLTVEVEPDVPLVEGDYEKLQRMAENLASNAVKFTPDGGSVRLEARCEPGMGDVLVQVRDTGIGIAGEDQARIFERFVQVDGTSTRKFTGSGLGLALVRGYADAQGFEVGVESELGEGSVFTIRIPADRIVR